MKMTELRDTLLELVQLYFTKATVTFAKQSFVVPPSEPLVTITMGSVNIPLNPPTKIIDGRPVSFYPATVPVQVDLFTHGRQRDIGPGVTPVVENTAAEDMLAFVGFLNSQYVTVWCREKDIAVIVPNTVNDVTDLVQDTNFEFRAMIELTVNFTMEVIGYTGMLDIESVKHTDPDGHEYSGGDIQADDVSRIDPALKETPSGGGGNTSLLSAEDVYVDSIEIHEENP